MVGRPPFRSLSVVSHTHPRTQASKLHTASRCDPPLNNKRPDSIYNILGALPIRRILGPPITPTSLDIHNNCTFLYIKLHPIYIRILITSQYSP